MLRWIEKYDVLLKPYFYMNEDLVIKKIINLDERLIRVEENMATKQELRGLVKGQDKMITILERLDQERLFTEHHLKQIEQDQQMLKDD